jgi:hypothetical protein
VLDKNNGGFSYEHGKRAVNIKLEPFPSYTIDVENINQKEQNGMKEHKERME